MCLLLESMDLHNINPSLREARSRCAGSHLSQRLVKSSAYESEVEQAIAAMMPGKVRLLYEFSAA